MTTTSNATRREPIPVTILSGFLGSGKTTLLNVLLRANHGRRLAVIVNEFGAVGIDGALVPQGERFVELDNGCLCCALNEDLVATLEELQHKTDIDHILIETTGLADPLPVAWTCSRPGLSQAMRVDSIVTVVDALALPRALSDSREARMQVQRADILVLNKLDLVADGGRAADDAVRKLNTDAPLVRAEHGQVPWHLVLGDLAQGRGLHVACAPIQGGHSHGTQAERYHTVSLSLPGNAPLDEAALEALTYDIPAGVFRFKGLLRVDSPEGPWLLINGVAGRIDLRFLTPSVVPPVSALVFIGQKLDGPSLRTLCARALDLPEDRFTLA